MLRAAGRVTRRQAGAFARRLLPCVFACAVGTAEAGWVSDAIDLMGTRCSVELWDDDEARGRELVAAALEEYRRIDRLMSTYKPDSEISRVNAEAAGGPVAIGIELYSLIEQSQQLSVASDGAFDITFDSVGYLYDFRERRRPDDAEIAAALDAIDYRHIVLDPAAHTIRFARSGVRINLGGIAKGYAVQRAADLLRERGVEHALLNAGGDTRVLGDRRGEPWIFGIRHPRAEDQFITRLPMIDEAISTSGDYERFFEEDGKRYHHIINPSTGRPTEGVLTVTVIGPDGTMTDGLDTAIFVLGPDAGLELIKRYPEYEAIVVDADGKISYSDGLTPP